MMNDKVEVKVEAKGYSGSRLKVRGRFILSQGKQSKVLDIQFL
jgi:hypothetical protein